MKLLRVFEYGSSGTSGNRTYWTLAVEPDNTAAEVADMVAAKVQHLQGTYQLYEVSVDGTSERRLDDSESPLSAMSKWSDNAPKIFAVKKNTIVRFYDATGDTYVTMDLVDKQGKSKTVRQAEQHIQKKRGIKESLAIVEIESSYVGKTERLLSDDELLMTVRLKWDISSTYVFGYRVKSDSDESVSLEAIGSQTRIINETIAPLKQISVEERKQLLPTIESECLDWMQRCLHYKFKSNEFWEVLRENTGEHLINLLNVFTANGISTNVVLTGGSDLNYLKNLDLVCDAMLRFGLNKTDVMRPEDVIERRSNVLYTLFVLAFEAHRRGHPQEWTSLATKKFFDTPTASSAASDLSSSLKAVNKAKAAAKRKAAASNNNNNATTSSKAGDAGAAVSYKAISDSGAMSPNFESSAITRAETLAATMGVPPVHAAIKSDDSEALSGLMARGGAKAANTPNAKNQAPLHWAANLQKLDAVRALLLVGAEVDPRDGHDATPLHLAAARGNVPIVRALLAAGADANALSKFGVTPLVVACDAPKDAVLLLDAMLEATTPPDVNVCAPDDLDTPLHTAARGDRADVLERLLTAGATPHSVNAAGDTPLLVAVKVGAEDCVRALLKHAERGTPNRVEQTLSFKDADGLNAAQCAAAVGLVELAEFLESYASSDNVAAPPAAASSSSSSSSSSPSEVPTSPSPVVATTTTTTATTPTPTPTPTPTTTTTTTTTAAATSTSASDSNMSASTKRSLGGQTPHPEPDEQTKLFFKAAKNGQDAEVKRLLASGNVSVDSRDVDSNSALHMACAADHSRVLKKLLAAKVKLTLRNDGGETCMHVCARHDSDACAALVLKVLGKPEKHRVLLSFADASGATPLHVAAAVRRSTHNVLARLLATGVAPVGAPDNAGLTPLLVAAQCGNFEALKQLLALREQPPPEPTLPSPRSRSSGALTASAERSARSTVVDVTARVAATGDMALHLAVAGGHLQCVSALLGAEAPINVTNNAGQTPLHLATSNGESEVVELLLAHRADITVKTNDGKLARDLATDDVTRSLIDAAAARAKSSN